MESKPAHSDELVALGLSLRPSTEADRPFQRALFVSFRAGEMALVRLPQAQIDALLDQQFRFQHHHFVTHFAGADFWVVERSLPPAANVRIGRFYLDRSTPVWRVVDIGFCLRRAGRGSVRRC